MKRLMFLVLSSLFLFGCDKPTQKPVASELEQLESRLSTAPSFVNHISYGLALGKAGRKQESLAAYQKALEINPNAPVGWNNLCFAYIDLGEPGKAEDACKKALELEPSFQLAKNNLALAQQKMKDLKQRLINQSEELQKSQEPSPQKAIDLGMAFYNLKDFQGAIRVWELVSPTDPLYPIAQNNIASSNILLGSLQSAENAIRKALERDPNNSLFKNNRAWLEQEKAKVK